MGYEGIDREGNEQNGCYIPAGYLTDSDETYIRMRIHTYMICNTYAPVHKSPDTCLFWSKQLPEYTDILFPGLILLLQSCYVYSIYSVL